MKIYICGGSTELDEIARRMDQLRAMGHEITHDWTAAIRAAGGEANPRTATYEQCRTWSADDMLGVEAAELVWVMLPDRTSFGCGVEFGYALSLGGDVIVSGDWRASVFTSQAAVRFDTHDEALAWILNRSRRLRGY